MLSVARQRDFQGKVRIQGRTVNRIISMSLRWIFRGFLLQAGHPAFRLAGIMSETDNTPPASPGPPLRWTALMAAMIYSSDQLTKFLVLKSLGHGQEKIIVDGFFRFVHWQNTGASWSLFRDNNSTLAVIAGVAFVVLVVARKHFSTQTLRGQLAFGMILGGIAGNLTDRILPARQHVIDFLRFYAETATGEVGFPAFNIADTGICVGVATLFWVTWQTERAAKNGCKVEGL